MKPSRTLTLLDIVLMNLAAVVTLRWIGSAAANGPSSLTLWALAALFFFIPEALAVAELSSRFPGEGGLYRWTRQSLGESHGFLCGWCYWLNNLLYFPGLLLFVAANIAFAVQAVHPGWELQHDKTFVVAVTLGALWLVALLSYLGVGAGKWLQNLGGASNWIPVLIVVGIGGYVLFSKGSANPITPATLAPRFGDLSQLSFFAQICFALGGLELVSFFGGDVKNPRRTLTLGIAIGAVLIFLVYGLGTLGILLASPSEKLTTVNGILFPVQQVGVWLVALCAIMLALGNLGTTMAWFAGSARVPYLVGVDHYLPQAFGKLHPKRGTPYVAILVQVAVATAFTLFTTMGKESRLELAYKIMVDMCLLLYFIPYCYLFLALFKLRETSPKGEGYRIPGGAVGNWIVAVSGLSTTVLAIAFTVFPTGDSVDRIALAKTLGGTLVMLLLGFLLYWRGQRALNPAAAS